MFQPLYQCPDRWHYPGKRHGLLRRCGQALQKLTTGTKTVTINFDDGKAATKLTIKTGSSGTGDSISPKTGDDSKPVLWLAVMMLSGLGIGGLVVNDKKRRYLSRH